MDAWTWTVSGRDAHHRGSHPRDFTDSGVIEAEHLAEAAVRVVRDEIEWLGLDGAEPVTLTLTAAE